MVKRQMQAMKSSGGKHAQQGAVLLVALILLLVLTLIGITTMESTGMEMKMASQQRERLVAMQSAEAGLLAAEDLIQTVGFSDGELADSGCAVAQNCFKPDCSDGGFCFNGANADNLTTCTLAPQAPPVWESAALNVWGNAGRHQTLNVPNATVNYVIEFLCYIHSDPSDSAVLTGVNASKLFRITALATTTTGKGRVMLQSTYRIKVQ